MPYLSSYLIALFDLFGDFWIYFLAGFAVAGLVHEFVPADVLMRHFGRNSLVSLVKASFVGLSASLCSCGAIPLAIVMRRKGATTANALTFLLASPWAGFTQLFILAGFIGAWRTGVIFVMAMGTALTTGGLLAVYERRGWIEGALDPSSAPVPEPASCTDNSGGCHPDASDASNPADGCCDENPATGDAANAVDPCGCLIPGGTPLTVYRRMGRGLLGSWEVMKEIGLYLMIGMLIAAALKAFVPERWIGEYLGTQSASGVLLAVPVSAALELCSEGFSIVAGQLFPMGASLAVVFVMLIVGVTTDFTEMLVIYKRFGRRSMLAYLGTATVCAVTAAYGLWFIMR